MKRNPFKIIWLVLGLLSLGAGSIGILVPVLPTVPLYMLTAFCFAKSSAKLHTWFIQTEVYKKYLERFVQRKEMTMKAKLSVVITVTLVMGIGFILMDGLVIGRVCLAVVWICHILYFFFRVKTMGGRKQTRVHDEEAYNLAD